MPANLDAILAHIRQRDEADRRMVEAICAQFGSADLDAARRRFQAAQNAVDACRQRSDRADAEMLDAWSELVRECQSIADAEGLLFLPGATGGSLLSGGLL